MFGPSAAQSVPATISKLVGHTRAWTSSPLTATGGIYWEEMHHDEKSGGIAIKMTKEADGLNSGAPQQVWAYNLDGGTVWYDLSTVFGAPFAGSRLDVTGDNGGSIMWPNGIHPGGNQLTKAPSEGNIFFSINPA